MESGAIKVFRNFVEDKSFKTTFTNEGLFGGKLLGVKSRDFLVFYDWDTLNVIRRIDVSPAPKQVYWSESGSQIVLALEEAFYLLSYNQDEVDVMQTAISRGQTNPDWEEDGLEEAFTFLEEYNETVTSGQWISNECFIFTNPKGGINYLVGSKILRLAVADKKYFIMGYDDKKNRLYLVDKNQNLVSYSLLLSLVLY